ncbi:DUF1847 domain-containing protein [Chloroflexota bacterium]
MAAKPESSIMCNACQKVECRHDYPKGIPQYCLATKFHDTLEETKLEYSKPGMVDIYLAAGKVVTKGYRQWSRIQESIEFARELGIAKVGLASCIALRRELADVAELFTGAGFDVVCVTCQIGRVHPKDRGVPDLEGLRGTTCNPIAQAEILNHEETQLNYVLGLCLGHDILFNRYSKAPVSTLIVKDRITCNNPAAVLSGFHQRQYLWETYCGKDID